MASEFSAVFESLRPVLAAHGERLKIKTDTPSDYTLVTKSASQFPRHKGHPLEFGAVRSGKAYVSFHLMPLYMCDPLTKQIAPELKKRMQGKTCFNFRTVPDADAIRDLAALTAAALKQWESQKWL
jgi:hypothetical protein